MVTVTGWNVTKINRENNMLLYQCSIYIICCVIALEEPAKISVVISFNLLQSPPSLRSASVSNGKFHSGGNSESGYARESRIPKGRVGQLQPTGRPHHSLSLRAAREYTYIEKRG
jgi:hypothetical protein